MTTAQPTQMSNPEPTRPSRAGVISLVLGIVAIVAAFIPFLSYVAWVVAIAAIVVAVVALTRRNLAKRGSAITGLILGVLALILSIVMSIVYTTVFFLAAAASSLSTYSPDASAPAVTSLPTASPTSGERSVTYSASGSGTATNITYLVADTTGGGTDQVSDVKLPWSKSVPIKDPKAFSTTVFSLVVQAGANGKKVTCKIEADGKVISKHSASGAYAVASCSGTAD